VSSVQAAELQVSLLRVARRLRQEKSDDELSDAQFSTLSLLDRRGPLSPRELADLERVQPPSMTRTLAGLLERGLVDRAENPQDRRQAIVRLTGPGVMSVKETRRRRDAWLTKQLEELSHSDQEVLDRAAEVLRRIADS
jgi:DNA-binding MarR family transcriptional regulator